uniref:hypothetical protein n=1 Tax=Halomonas halophila TaxID=29573 RepID=UPI0036D213E5
MKKVKTLRLKYLKYIQKNAVLALSIKALEEAPKSEKKASKAPATDYSKDMPEETTGFTLGDIIGDSLKDSDK